MIPRIIHYCWLSNDPVPEKFQKNIEGWKEKLYDYEFIKWDFTRFDKEDSVWVKEAFESKRYAFAADYIRLYAVYHYGGIYLDMDVEVIKRFDPLLDKDYMFAYERFDQEWIEAGCFGAEKNNAFIGMCLDRYYNRHFIKQDGTYDQTTLPRIMTEILKDGDYELTLYCWDYFTAKSFETGTITRTNNTYAIHHFAGSWKTEREKEILLETQMLTKHFPILIARNIAEYKSAIKHGDVFGITAAKIRRKLTKHLDK